jgi:hypothetical protein
VTKDTGKLQDVCWRLAGHVARCEMPVLMPAPKLLVLLCSCTVGKSRDGTNARRAVCRGDCAENTIVNDGGCLRPQCVLPQQLLYGTGQDKQLYRRDVFVHRMYTNVRDHRWEQHCSVVRRSSDLGTRQGLCVYSMVYSCHDGLYSWVTPCIFKCRRLTRMKSVNEMAQIIPENPAAQQLC